MSITDFFNSLSALTASASFAFGIYAWRREFIGKKRIELIEELLAKFYQSEDIIKEIRTPWSFSSEGTTRKHEKGETAAETTILNRAYIPIERYKKHEEFFSDLRSMRYRAKSVFGPEIGTAFDLLDSILKKIFISSEMLGKYYWTRQGRVEMDEAEREKHLKEMHEHESIFWNFGPDNDPIGEIIHRAIEATEKIAQKEYGATNSLGTKIKNILDNAKAYFACDKKSQ